MLFNILYLVAYLNIMKQYEENHKRESIMNNILNLWFTFENSISVYKSNI